MKVSETMTRKVMVVAPDQTVQEAARLMADGDVGSLPVGQGDRLVGMVTDRDIAIRAVSKGLGPDTKINDVMSHEVMYCFEDEDLDDVACNMGDIQVRRLPVVNRDKRLVGIVSISDIASCEDAARTGKAVAGISTPGGEHSHSSTH